LSWSLKGSTDRTRRSGDGRLLQARRAASCRGLTSHSTHVISGSSCSACLKPIFSCFCFWSYALLTFVEVKWRSPPKWP